MKYKYIENYWDINFIGYYSQDGSNIVTKWNFWTMGSDTPVYNQIITNQ